jgi:hypothetical protein
VGSGWHRGGIAVGKEEAENSIDRKSGLQNVAKEMLGRFVYYLYPKNNMSRDYA